jgi:NADH-quinone oxidoreductase subunit J
MESFLFYTIAGVTGMCAIATVVTQNIVRAASWLLFTLAGTSGIFFLLGADLVGAVQLLVYVGGTLVLVVFGVMLTAQGPFISMKTSSAEWALSATVGVALLAVLAVGVFSIPDSELRRPATARPGDFELIDNAMQVGNLSKDTAKSPYSAVIGQGFIGAPVGPPHIEHQSGEIKTVRAAYLLPFEIVSVHLLVVLIGAAYLARAKRRRATILHPPAPGNQETAS